MTPITLPPLAEMKAKALTALDEGRLQCQQPGFTPGKTQCVYAGPCAIGVALKPEEAAALDAATGNSIGSLLQQGYLQINPSDPPETEIILKNIQAVHDAGLVSLLRESLQP